MSQVVQMRRIYIESRFKTNDYIDMILTGRNGVMYVFESKHSYPEEVAKHLVNTMKSRYYVDAIAAF